MQSLSYGRFGAGLALTVWLVQLIGCGAANSGYETPDAAVQAFNDFAGKEYAEVSDIVQMIHPENDKQQQMVDAIKSMLPYLQLDAAMRAEFNTPFERISVESLYGQIVGPARVIEQTEDRATAEYMDCNEQVQQLHLVKQNNAWRLSGYTLERHPQIAADFEAGNLTLNINNRDAFARVAPEMITRIRAAEFPYQLAARRTAHELAGVHFERPIPGGGNSARGSR